MDPSDPAPVLDARELGRARRFLDADARIAATQDGTTTVQILCGDPATTAQQAHKFHIAALDARERAALAARPGPSAARKAARLIALPAGA